MGVNFVNCNQLGTGTVMKLLWRPTIDHVKVNTPTSENSRTKNTCTRHPLSLPPQKKTMARLKHNPFLGAPVPRSPVHGILNNGPAKTMAGDKR